jgi:hypothetical protein
MPTSEQLLEQCMYRLGKVSTQDGKRTLATDQNPLLLEVFALLGWGDPYVIPVVEPPMLTALDPSSATLGDPDLTLRVFGTGFAPDAVILWNGSPEPTVFVSATELTTGVNMATAEVAMPIPVAVRSGGGIESAPLTFTLLARVEPAA